MQRVTGFDRASVGGGEAEVRIVAPTGCLGYGFSISDFRRIMERHRPHAIAVDAGSTDPGPFYLGSGESFAQELEVRGELEVIIQAGLDQGIPVIVGTSGGAGGRPHVDWTRRIVEELAAQHGWTFRLGVIQAELEPGYLAEKLDVGAILPFESEEVLSPDVAAASHRVVAQMGVEPIVEALQQGAQVVLAGRACDDAVFAAVPIMLGFDRGLALHMGKVLECGALASVPIAMDVMLGTIRSDHFELVPGSQGRACTVTSVSSHSLYEREDPLHQVGPGGTVDLSSSRIEQLDERTVRVTGTRYQKAREYLLKLEGVRRLGTRVIAIAGIRDPTMISQLDDALEEARRRTEAYLDDLAVARSYKLGFHVYGRDAVMKSLEPIGRYPHEVGLVIEVVDEDPAIAKAVCQHVTGRLLHLDFPGQLNNAGNLALLTSPANIVVGDVHVFSVYHLLRVEDPLEPFEIEVEDIGVTPVPQLKSGGRS
jgi:hypothetical protein